MSIAFRLLQFSLFLIPLAFFTGTKDHFLIKETLTLVFLLAAIGIFIINVIESKSKLKFDSAKILIITFILSELLSIINARIPVLALNLILIHSCLLLVYILCLNLDYEHKNIIFNTILLTGFISSFYGLFQHFGIDFIEWSADYQGRPASAFGNPNFFAGYIIVLLPVSIVMFFKTVRTKKMLWLLLGIMLALNLLFNRTRGAWLACFISLAYLFMFTRKKGKFFVMLAVTLMLLAGTIYFIKRVAYTEYLNSAPPAVAERFFKWQTAAEMISEHPVVGVGAGNLKTNFALYQATIRKRLNFNLRGTSESNVHNDFFQVWAETGTVGFLAFILIFVLYFLSVLKRRHLPHSSSDISAGVLAFIFFCLTNFPLRIMPVAILTFALMGLSANSSEFGVSAQGGPASGWHSSQKVDKKTNWLLRILVFIIYFILIWKFAVNPFIADAYRKTADEAVQINDSGKAIKYYEKSILLDEAHSERSAFDLGELYRKTGRIDDAIRAYNISVEVRNYGEVYNNLGNCYWMKKDFVNAAKNWEMAVNLGLPNPVDQKNTDKNLQIAKKKIK